MKISQHIEQHRHATYLPDPYYLEGLKRDPGDSRINNAYGMLLLRRGNFEEAETYFRVAIKRLIWRSPNPYNSEPYYNLAAIEAGRGEYESALELVEKGLVKNIHNIKTRGLKAVILRKLGQMEEAKAWLLENLKIAPFDYVSLYELAQISEDTQGILNRMNGLMRDFHENYLQAARDYAEAKFYEEAVEILNQCTKKHPMIAYYKGYYLGKAGRQQGRRAEYTKADAASPLYCFPNKLEDIAVLKDAMVQYPTVHRNLALAYFNKRNDAKKAKMHLEKAFD